MRRRVVLVVLVACWLTALYAGDFTMPGERGRVRPPLQRDNPFTALSHPGSSAAAGSYVAGMLSNASGTFMSMTALINRLHAVPFIAGTVLSFDQALAGGTGCGALFPFEIITGSGSPGVSCKLAIYDSPPGIRQPNHVLFQSGDLSVASASVEVGAIPPPSLQLLPNALYWFVLWCNGAASIRGYPQQMSWPFAGGDGIGTGIAGNAFRPTSTYAASFPDPFPTSSVITLVTVPNIQACFR